MISVTRRRAREVVVQMLYADDLNPQRNQAEADEFLRRRLHRDPTVTPFAQDLVAGVRRNREAIDAALQRQAANWSLARMAAIDRNILRLGAYELLHTQTPPAVVINEAVEIAKRYGGRNSAPFVNGILDRLNPHRRRKSPE